VLRQRVVSEQPDGGQGLDKGSTMDAEQKKQLISSLPGVDALMLWRFWLLASASCLGTEQ